MTCKRSFWFFGFVRCGYRDGGVGLRERGRRGEGFGVLIHRVLRIEFVRELEFVFDAAEGAEEELADVGERDAVRAEMRFARRRCGGGRGRGS